MNDCIVFYQCFIVLFDLFDLFQLLVESCSCAHAKPACCQPASCLASQPGSQLAVYTAATFSEKLKKLKQMKKYIVFYQCFLVFDHFL